jgi:phosphoglucomutase
MLATIRLNFSQLLEQYYSIHPDPANPSQKVTFGTSGHRGSSANGTFNEDHILAISQAVAEYRANHGINGPLYMGRETHALSAPAQKTALEVLAAHGIDVYITREEGDALNTPTPAVSHAILTCNRGKKTDLADGIIITPSHNPPSDGGYKYNPPSGGPAEEEITQWIQQRANNLLASQNRQVKRISYERALTASTTHYFDFVTPMSTI